MTQLSDQDWQTINKALVREFGDDLAQFAIVKLLEVQSEGTEVRDPLAWCRLTAKRQNMRDSHRGKFFISLDEFIESAWQGGEATVPDSLIDGCDPERIAIAREELEHVNPSLVALEMEDAIDLTSSQAKYARQKLRQGIPHNDNETRGRKRKAD